MKPIHADYWVNAENEGDLLVKLADSKFRVPDEVNAENSLSSIIDDTRFNPRRKVVGALMIEDGDRFRRTIRVYDPQGNGARLTEFMRVYEETIPQPLLADADLPM